jgi:predicted CoA-binding protein
MLHAPQDRQITSLLAESTTIAVVGMSPKSQRPSNTVAAYLIAQGYRVVPVNPGHSAILGLTCYPELRAIPERVEIVDIFRNSRAVAPIVDQAVEIGAKAVWMQQGIVNYEAAERADNGGLVVVMDRCIKVEHARLIL